MIKQVTTKIHFPIPNGFVFKTCRHRESYADFDNLPDIEKYTEIGVIWSVYINDEQLCSSFRYPYIKYLAEINK